MERIKKALRYGAVDYLIKPFEFDRLSRALVAYKEQTRFIQTQHVINQDVLDHQNTEPRGKASYRRIAEGINKRYPKTNLGNDSGAEKCRVFNRGRCKGRRHFSGFRP